MASSSQIEDVVERIEARRTSALAPQPSRWPGWAKEIWALLEIGREPTAADAELVVLVAHQLLMLESEGVLEDARHDAEHLAKRGTKVRPATLRRRAQQAVIAGA